MSARPTRLVLSGNWRETGLPVVRAAVVFTMAASFAVTGSAR